MSREHPRVRGENKCRLGNRLLRTGNIPACAGKTTTAPYPSATTQEHPRVRGENNASRGDVKTITGTSPRARGKLLDDVTNGFERRNIPACAGKTGLNSKFSSTMSEHPRVRGENGRTSRTRLMRKGTSPRARGKPPPVGKRPGRSRNIPACVGKTFGYQCSWLPWQEHPRVRGENHHPGDLAVARGGTSPRARGKQAHLEPARPVPRNIPACAGKTNCGRVLSTSAAGTSPRARGKPVALTPHGGQVRNIPACAGKTSYRPS